MVAVVIGTAPTVARTVINEIRRIGDNDVHAGARKGTQDRDAIAVDNSVHE